MLEIEQQVSIFRPACIGGQAYIPQPDDPCTPPCIPPAPNHTTYQPRIDVTTGNKMPGAFTKFVPSAFNEAVEDLKLHARDMAGKACAGALDSIGSQGAALENMIKAANVAIEAGKKVQEVADKAQNIVDRAKGHVGLDDDEEKESDIQLDTKSCLDPVIKELKDKMFIQFDPSNSPEQKLAALTYVVEKMISDRDQ